MQGAWKRKQENLHPRDACVLNKKDRLHPNRVIYGLGTCSIKPSGLKFAMPYDNLPVFPAINILFLYRLPCRAHERKNQGNHLPNDACVVKKINCIHIESSMV